MLRRSCLRRWGLQTQGRGLGCDQLERGQGRAGSGRPLSDHRPVSPSPDRRHLRVHCLDRRLSLLLVRGFLHLWRPVLWLTSLCRWSLPTAIAESAAPRGRCWEDNRRTGASEVDHARLCRGVRRAAGAGKCTLAAVGVWRRHHASRMVAAVATAERFPWSAACAPERWIHLTHSAAPRNSTLSHGSIRPPLRGGPVASATDDSATASSPARCSRLSGSGIAISTRRTSPGTLTRSRRTRWRAALRPLPPRAGLPPRRGRWPTTPTSRQPPFPPVK